MNHHSRLSGSRSHSLGILLLVLTTTSAYAATFPAGFTGTQVATVSTPTAMAFAPDGRLFVCQQTGALRIIKNDVLIAKPFLTVTVNSTDERGLLGVALDPDFGSNGFVYVYYTATSPAIHNRISRFTANGDTALSGGETLLLELNNLGATNHNGGAIHFGPDGKLYAGVGENATGTNAQTLTNLLGKMLRINSDGTIPTDNPFYNTATGDNRAIWALGLRNPFTFAFQPGSTRMLINDVGENTWEEINTGIAGANYGWPTTEGSTVNPTFKSPTVTYNHSSGSFIGCAIVGGTFYNPVIISYPSSYVGDYFFADLCGGWIRAFHPADSTTRSFGTGVSSPVDLAVSPSGNLYYLYRGGGGGVVKVTYDLPLPVQLVSFTGIVTGSHDVHLSWTTISEVSSFGFYIQLKRQADQEFADVPDAFVPGNGTTNEPHSYSYTHIAPGVGSRMYRLRQEDLDGEIHFSEAITVDVVTGVKEQTLPRSFSLEQNYPNPFNPTTMIQFALPHESFVTLDVYNLLGERIAVLVDGMRPAGYYSEKFSTEGLSGGIYFYRLRSGSFVQTRKLLLLK